MPSNSPSSTPSVSLIQQIPADQVYWSRIATGAAKKSVSAQLFRFEHMLPVPVDKLQCTHVRLSGDESIFVAIEPHCLQLLLSEFSATGITPWQLIPREIPEHIRAGLDDEKAERAREQLNLLHGPFEPTQRRRWRRLLWLSVHLGLLFVVFSLLVGTERRLATYRHQVSAIREQNLALISKAIPPSNGNRPDLAEPLLVMEIRRLEQVADSSRATSDANVIGLLQNLWQKWPKDLPIQVDSWSIGSDRMTLNAKVKALSDAERLFSLCAEINAGNVRFRADPLQAQMNDGQASLVLSWTRSPAATTGRTP